MNFHSVLTKKSNSLIPKKHTLTVHPIFARADPLADATAPILSNVGYSAISYQQYNKQEVTKQCDKPRLSEVSLALPRGRPSGLIDSRRCLS